MFKKVLALLLVCVMMFSFAACTTNTGNNDANETGDVADNNEAVDLKVGFIFLHDENSTYDKNFMDAAKAACEEMGVEYAQKTQEVCI